MSNSRPIQITQLTNKTISKEHLNQLVRLVQQQFSSSATKESVLAALSSTQSIILGAFSDDILVGTASLVYSHCVTGTRVHIEDVVVDSEQRGKGIGTYLINETIDRAKKLQAKSIDLTSRPDREAANRLYRKLGFVQRETNVYRYASP
ncbi:hypothetical protein RMCBS344292_09203 [Rhizopus microsporus]|nr:hypothetical protein RMCBS344292_09203 [Rhizopus microsporus]